MPWEECSVMDERLQLVASRLAELCTGWRASFKRFFFKQFDLRRRAAHQDRKITGFGSPGARADVIIRKCTLIQADGYAFCFAGFQ